MSSHITVQQGLAAHFKQPNGTSRSGIDWMLGIEGDKNAKIIVRTYMSGDAASEEEKTSLADSAVAFIQNKIEPGWEPASGAGILEATDV